MSNKVSAKVYNRDYFLYHRGGSGEFLKSKGKELCESHKFAIKIAGLKPSDKILDLGCGCGEIALNAASYVDYVLAIDYSKEAIDLALQAKQEFDPGIQKKVTFIHTDLEKYELPEQYFDVVFFIDVIEHLVQEEINYTLMAIQQCLKPDGKLIVHTWPNRWHRQITYPISYYMGKITGKRRPKEPKLKHEQLMHVSEQSPWELRLNLKKAGFITKVFLRFARPCGKYPNEWFYWFFHAVPPFKWFFCDQIWAIAKKQN